MKIDAGGLGQEFAGAVPTLLTDDEYRALDWADQEQAGLGLEYELTKLFVKRAAARLGVEERRVEEMLEYTWDVVYGLSDHSDLNDLYRELSRRLNKNQSI